MPILSKAKDPSKNTRSLFFGYLMVFMTYCIVGIFGYFAFGGSGFKDIYAAQKSNRGIIS